MILATFCSASGRTWYITPDGTGDAPTIQAGIDSASIGDDISLADGVYRGEGNRDIVCHGKAVTVRSGSGSPEACIIDCQGSESDPHRGFIFECSGGCHSRLEGLRIVNGYACYGGAILDHYGASSIAIVSCVFSDNYSSMDGGAIEGMLLNISECTFLNNSCFWYGGAVNANRASSILDCTFIGNAANEGGAVSLQNSGQETPQTVICGCVFLENLATLNSGAVMAWNGPTNFTLEQCILAGNTGEASMGEVIGLVSWSSEGISGFAMTNCTVAGNQGGIGDICKPREPHIERTIIAYNTRAITGCAQPVSYTHLTLPTN